MDKAIKHEDNGKVGRITLYDEETLIGELIYLWNGTSTFTITSTEVNPAHRGNGYAKTLVLKAAEIAKERQAKVIPQCSYARAVFERAPDLRALIAK